MSSMIPSSLPDDPADPILDGDDGGGGALQSVPMQLAGQVQTQYVRCGKIGCRCASGEPHGPYYYRTWRDGHRTRKVYVKESEVAAVRAACESYAQYKRELRDWRARRSAVLSQLRSEWRAAQSLISAVRKQR